MERGLIEHLLDVPTPAALHRLPNVPLPLRVIFDSIQNSDLVPLGQLCNNLLHKFLVRIGLRKGTHILQVPGPKSAHFRKGAAQVLREPIDDFGTPAFVVLSIQYVSSML